MRHLKRLVWAGVFAGALGLTAAPAAAQQGSVTTGSGGQTLGGSLTGTGGVGRTGGTAGYAGVLGANMNDGTVVALPVQISYPAVVRFPVTPVAAPQLQTDLSGIVSRSGIGNPGGVQVTVEGNTVTL